jgi:hypothetical protein
MNKKNPGSRDIPATSAGVRVPAFATAALLAATIGTGTAGAALLTFDAAVCEDTQIACANGLKIHQSVGDSAELDVVYANRTGPGNAPEFATNLSGIRWFNTGYGDLAGVLWARGDGGVGEIALRPVDGFQVSLTGFDLGSFYADTATSWAIYDGDYNLLAASGPLVLDAFGTSGRIHYHYDFDLTSASGLVIQWGPDSANVALDNLQFDLAPVPAPASVVLFATGLAAAAGWRRKRRGQAARAARETSGLR